MTTKLAFGLLGMGAVMILAAIAGDRAVSRQEGNDRVVVVYWEKWTGAEAREMQKTVNQFNASQNKIFVRYLSISNVDQKTLLATAGGNPPDVAGIWLDQLAQFADMRALTDLTSIAKENDVKASNYIPGFYNGLVYHGKLWGLPSTPATIALYVRSDLLPAQYASPETFPKTLDTFDDLMFKISKKASDGSITMAGFLPSSPGWYNWSWGPLFGGHILAGDKLTINSPTNVRAFEWVANYANQLGPKEVAKFQSGFGTFSTPDDPFLDGKTVCEVNGVWKPIYVDTYRPGTPWFAVPFPYPKDRPDLADHSFINEDILVIPRGAKHVAEGFQFIKYIQRQDVMERLCKAQGKNSALAKVSADFFNGHENSSIRLFDRLARSKTLIPTPQIGIFPQIRAEIDVAFQEINTGQKSPKQALDDAQARLNGLWSTYRTQILGAAN